MQEFVLATVLDLLRVFWGTPLWCRILVGLVAYINVGYIIGKISLRYWDGQQYSNGLPPSDQPRWICAMLFPLNVMRLCENAPVDGMSEIFEGDGFYLGFMRLLWPIKVVFNVAVWAITVALITMATVLVVVFICAVNLAVSWRLLIGEKLPYSLRRTWIAVNPQAEIT